MRTTYAALPGQAYRILHQSDGDTGLLLLSQGWRFDDAIDWDRLTHAVQRLAVRHPVLTAVFAPDGSSYDVGAVAPLVQVLPDDSEWFAGPPDLSNTKGPVFSVRGTTTRVEVWVEHSVCDGKSFDILVSELSDLYNGRELPPVEGTLDEYAALFSREASRQRESAGCSRWLESLRSADWPPPFELVPSLPGLFETADVPVAASDLSAARRDGISPTTFAIHIAARSLARTMSAKRILVSVTSAIRPAPRFRRTVADFANRLLLSAGADEPLPQIQGSLGLAMANYAIFHSRVSDWLGYADATRLSVDLVRRTDSTFRLGHQVGEELVSGAVATTRDLRFRLRLDAADPKIVVSRRHGYDGVDFESLVESVHRACSRW